MNKDLDNPNMSKILPGSALDQFYKACVAHVPGPEIDNYEALLDAITNGNIGPLLAEYAFSKGWVSRFEFRYYFKPQIAIQCTSGERIIGCTSSFLAKFADTVEYAPKNTPVAAHNEVIVTMHLTEVVAFLGGIKKSAISLGKVWELLPQLCSTEPMNPQNSTTFFPVLRCDGAGDYEAVMVSLQFHDSRWNLDISPYSTGLFRVDDQIIYTPR